jgi:WD40 repeat protein
MLWDVARRSQTGRLPMHGDRASSMAFSPDGRVLAVATAMQNQKIILWDMANRTPLATLQNYLNPVGTLAFSPDNRTLASGSYDGPWPAVGQKPQRDVGVP